LAFLSSMGNGGARRIGGDRSVGVKHRSLIGADRAPCR
jgi:hypothetical protein